MKTAKAVADGGKMNDEQLGKLTRRFDEIKRRINEDTLSFDEVLDGLQMIVEGKFRVSQNLLSVDRSTPFNLTKFLGRGWTIEEEDNRSLKLTELDLVKVKFVDMLEKGETTVQGEEKLKRLKKAGHIRLDVKVFQTLWENQHLIPASWKEKVNGNTRFIYFDGTVLRSSDGTVPRSSRGGRCVLGLYWAGGEWRWVYYWLGADWGANGSSVVLAS